MTTKKPTRKYLALLERAKTTRRFINDHPGLTYQEIKKSIRMPVGFDPPVGWLVSKNYITRIGGLTEIGGEVIDIPHTYVVKPMGELNDEYQKPSPDPVAAQEV